MALLIGDVSKWNLIEDYDLFCRRLDGAYVRVSEAKDDPLFATHWIAMGARRLARGGYHLYRPDLRAVDQVERFYGAVEETGDMGELPPALDVELVGQADHVLACLRGIEERFEVKPLVYTNWNTWKLMGFPAWGKDYRLWVANPSLKYANLKWKEGVAGLVSGLPAVPAPWKGWVLWQFTWSGYGRDWGLKWPDSKALDLSVFPGTVEELHALDGMPGVPGDPNPVPPYEPWDEVVVPPVGSRMRVVVNGLNVRVSPAAGGTRVKDIAGKGTEFMATGGVKDANYVWVETGLRQWAAMRRRDGTVFLDVVD